MNLNVAKASQSQRICEAASDACLHLAHSELFTSPSLYEFPLSFYMSVLLEPHHYS
jgi:hypothetical protein